MAFYDVTIQLVTFTTRTAFSFKVAEIDRAVISLSGRSSIRIEDQTAGLQGCRLDLSVNQREIAGEISKPYVEPASGPFPVPILASAKAQVHFRVESEENDLQFVYRGRHVQGVLSTDLGSKNFGSRDHRRSISVPLTQTGLMAFYERVQKEAASPGDPEDLASLYSSDGLD